ncbi:hypothetical protein [Hasllibacter sp. MH4015]|uniref:hypothetical protein n=1 Tax=Hasllibacter sp. MH4015 TaxID=2854029 RepID=UPI001CD6821A|nr:hypothetical protein [Hasllibacter sp. MH4015]
MAVKTGYTNAELSALAARIRAQAHALVTALPEEPLRALHLTCTCDRCIDPAAYPKLCRTPPPQMTEDLITQYFGGVAAVETQTTEEARFEARVILTHVLALFGRMVVMPAEEGRAMRRRLSYLDGDYLLPYLLRTGFLPRLSAGVRGQITAYLVDVAHYAIARGSAAVDTALCYVGIFTDALPDLLESYRAGPPRRHLRFWTALGRGFVTKGDDTARNGKDLHLWLRGMNPPDRLLVLHALEAPEVAMLFERYAFQARDPDWLQYLSNLLDWREKTILSTRYSEYKDEWP